MAGPNKHGLSTHRNISDQLQFLAWNRFGAAAATVNTLRPSNVSLMAHIGLARLAATLSYLPGLPLSPVPSLCTTHCSHLTVYVAYQHTLSLSFQSLASSVPQAIHGILGCKEVTFGEMHATAT